MGEARKPAVGALAPWYGGNRINARLVGEELAGCRWVGVPFAGSMAEVAYIDAPVVMVNDLHQQIINLALCAADPRMGPALYRRLRRLPFHQEALARAQEACRLRGSTAFRGCPDLDAAEDYFVAAWMGRSSRAGTGDEFNGRSAKRWNANGGGSAVRFRNAVGSLPAWRRLLRRCEFSVTDAFEFLANCQDSAGHGIYCDPPFPGVGAKYRHTFTEADHRRLAALLVGYRTARVVCRFYDHPLIRELYPAPHWTWRHIGGRTQRNTTAPEVLLINGPSLAKEPEEERLFA